MTDDMVKRLRSMLEGDLRPSAIGREAAARIEELEAEAKRLEAESNLQAKEIDKTRQRSDKWQSMILDCEQYLKPNETPAERIQREIDDCSGMMKLLEKKQTRIEELEAKLEKAVGALEYYRDYDQNNGYRARAALAELKAQE